MATSTDLFEATLSSASSSAEVVEALGGLISGGRLVPGTRLPTLRDLSGRTELSRSLLGTAWSVLRERGLIETRRRGGSYVTSPVGMRDGQPAPSSDPDDASQPFGPWRSVDFVTGHPYPGEQPDQRGALLRAIDEPLVNNPDRVFITDRLRSIAAAQWPFSPAAWTTVAGAGEAVTLAVEAAAVGSGPGGPGRAGAAGSAPIAVAEPVTPGTIAALRGLDLALIAVEQDERGPVPDSLARALEAGARTLLVQVNGSFGVEVAPDQRRIDELGRLIEARAPETVVVEEDVLGPLSVQQGLSFGTILPERVVRLRSYCRGYGVDLRTTVIGGPRELIERVRRLRSHGTAFNSRILQNALAHLLEDDAASGVVSELMRGLARRRRRLAEALEARGARWFAPEDPALIWVPARRETQALQSLAANGVVLSPSEHTFLHPEAAEGGPGYLRVAVAQLPESAELIDQLADLLVHAASDELSPPGF